MTRDRKEERLLSLLVDEAVRGLSEAGAMELEALLRETGAADREEMLFIAGLIQASFLSEDRESCRRMPEHLRAAIRQQGEAIVAARHPDAQ